MDGINNNPPKVVEEYQQQQQLNSSNINPSSTDSNTNLRSNISQTSDLTADRTIKSYDHISTDKQATGLIINNSDPAMNRYEGSRDEIKIETPDGPDIIKSQERKKMHHVHDDKSDSNSSTNQYLLGTLDELNGDIVSHQFENNDDEDNLKSNRFMMFDNDSRYDDNSDTQDEEDDDHNYDPHKKVIVGICAMEKKAQSKPMKEILRRLEDYFEFISTLVFEESVILNKPIEEWPLCDCLISFHSKGFPLSKAIEYARLRKPFLVNDLDIQYDIQDRRKVYKIIEEADIELPRYAVLDRDSANPEDRELIESDDHIEVANFVFNKPFVEKPISAEDHNICIYYPAHAGGGSQRLFRKIGCRSSVYSNESHVRKTGSYIYEEFMPTDGTDVKVYTAGPDYAHAEARKSPALDGKVERDMDGKEIRYPVILTNREKLIARKVCLAFKQTVCGFDLLRANGRSYVCDVNGFSFVKSSMKYYEDCSKILGNIMLRALAPQLHIPWSIPFQLDDPPIVPTTFGRMMELRCVVAVIRHGDRTPKQKMKLEVKHPKFFDLYQKYGNTKNGQAKLKKPKQLQEVLDIARYLLGELPDDQPAANEVIEPRVKLKQLKSVLEMYGHFSGINRKVQLKYQPHGRPRRSSSEDDTTREPSLVLILKWGGELTPAGRVQAEDLGRCFRRLYPASGDYSGPQGLGLLRLHSTFRHDLKIYASDEGRVQMTAAAFAKGFLALEGELTPILFQMVKSANTNGLLDNDCESSKCQKIVKERLHDIMQKNFDLIEEDMEILNPTNAPSIAAACKFISNPYQACEKVHKLIKDLNSLIRSKRQDNGYTEEYHLYHGETWDLLQRRWAKLEKDFKFRKSKKFDISKIPDIYDCIKYDLQHNQHTLQFQFAHELHTYAKALADIVIPQEYGMSDEEKLMISLGTCSPLLRKIQADLLRNADSTEDDQTESVNRLDPKYSHGVSSPDRHVRTRLYFTSESHIHSLVTALQYGGLLDVKTDEQWQRSMEFLSAISELNYLSQIVIMLYEDPTKDPTSDDRFHVEIHFSSGVINRMSQHANMPTEPQGPGFRPHLANKSLSNASSTGGKTINDDAPQQPDSDNSSHSLKSRLATGAAKQQVTDVMIKEEPTDDERSNEEHESKNNSKNSSVCITPRTSSPINTNEESLKPKDKSSRASLRQQSYQKSNQRCLSRSYSANTPISLQDLFKKSECLSRGEDVSEVADENVICDQKVHESDGGEILTSVQQSKSRESGEIHSDKNKTTIKEIGRVKANTTCEARAQQKETYNCVDNDVKREDLSNESASTQTPTQRKMETNSSLTPVSTTPIQTPRIPEKNNWKTYEQYLVSELTSSPSVHHHHHHHHGGSGYYSRHRRANQNDQQQINLPPTYHTIHHWNFSPSAANIVQSHHSKQQQEQAVDGSSSTASSQHRPAYHRPASISMSTSPQQTTNQMSGSSVGAGSNIHQRYLAHKQQQGTAGGRQFFTMSASMPIQYKSNQNPRACSVADVSQYCGGPSSLISTAVISGSSPELVAVCPYSPNIRPLETLHNELSLKPFIDFINRLTHNHRPSNMSSENNHSSNQLVNVDDLANSNDNVTARTRSSSQDMGNKGNLIDCNSKQRKNLKKPNNKNGQINTSALSPANSLSNSLIWSNPPSSFASSAGPSSPTGILELWSKLELEEASPATGTSNNDISNSTPNFSPSCMVSAPSSTTAHSASSCNSQQST